MTAGGEVVEKEEVDDHLLVEEQDEPKCSSSAPADEQPTDKTQTRFNFYNAEEVKQATSGEETDGGDDDDANKEPTRFSYYNPEEVHKSAPLHLPKPIDLTKLGAPKKHGNTKNDSTANTKTSSMTTQNNNVDSNEILRSLQETEREREISMQTYGTNNPYEAAIHDALAMIRSKMENDDKIMESREATYSEVRESDERSREERLAKYAAKLVQLEGRPLPTVSSSGGDDDGETTTKKRAFERGNQEEVDKLFRARTEDQEESVVPIQLAVSHETMIEEEVQKGVERVLMAILERAHSQGRAEAVAKEEAQETTTTTNNNNESSNGDRVNPPTRRAAEEYLTDDENDDDEDDEKALAKVPSESTARSAPSESLGTNRSGDTGNKRSVVDELLAENDDTVVDENAATTTHSSTMVALPVSPQSEFSKLTTEPGMDDDKAHKETVVVEAEEEEQEEDDDDDDDNSSEESDEDECEMGRSASLTQVLGPLSGNETGVVLESSDSIEASDTDAGVDADEEGTTGTRSDAPSSILESLSTAVKDAESFMSFMTGAINSPSSEAPAKKDADKYRLSNDAGEEDDEPDDDSYDGEANELMRSLCAHLLPYGVDKSTKHLSEIPPWDDSNPNEPGYRIIRLSKSQLRRVEREFERMVNGVKRSSERDLSKMKTDAGEDWNGAAASPYDQRFEKDLEEAEDLLDREEKMRAAVDQAEMVKKLSDDEVTSDDEEEETEGSDVTSEDEEDESSNSHPDFPGVRRSGKGEMGDLEFFTLPIIFKSHVTGFEPTKDLFLEPGNVVAGQYLVENELGSAAFSTAYRCIDLNSDSSGEGDFHEEVCLKVIKNTKDFFDQSLDEIKILELLRQTGKCHENNILEMKTFFYHREHLIIVTELLRQNLFEFGKFIIENNEEPYFTKRRLCYLTRQVLQALAFVHDLGLVHSDVKPENILLSSYSRAKVKLIDFGSSCYLTDRQSSYIQSRSYRAPEVVLGLPYDGKIDIWSLGCVVAEMYTGDVTFQNDSIVSMLSRIEAICGPFPRHMIAQGRQSSRFFSKSGLLYELVEPDERRPNPVQDDDESGLFDVFQPKRTTLAARLGFDPKALQQPATPQAQDQALFVDFCQSLLTIDPDSRLSAAQALQHPWIVSGESLTEEDIKYPSH